MCAHVTPPSTPGWWCTKSLGMQTSHWPQNLHLSGRTSLVTGCHWNDGLEATLFSTFFPEENWTHPNLFRQFFFRPLDTRQNAKLDPLDLWQSNVTYGIILDPLSSYSRRLHRTRQAPLNLTSHQAACEIWWLMWQGRLPSLFQGATMVVSKTGRLQTHVSPKVKPVKTSYLESTERILRKPRLKQ